MSEKEENLSKKDRIVNAWLAAESEAKANDIAEITDSSVAYASRIQNDIENGEIAEEEVEEVRDEQLIEEYETRLEQFQQEESSAEESEEHTETASGEEADTEGPGEGQNMVQDAMDQHQERQEEIRQQRRQSSQFSQQELMTDGQQTVSVERLEELDELLAVYEEEAQFMIKNLPQPHTAEAVGKLFVTQKTRSLLRDIVSDDQATEGQ